MKNYEQFKKILEEEILKHFPEGYKIKTGTIEKVNKTYDMLTIIPEETSEKTSISPAINIQDYYKEYINTGDTEKILSHIAAEIKKSMTKPPEINIKQLKENITFQLINTEQNSSLLKKVPGIKFHDLSIIFRSIVSMDGEGMSSILITNEIAERFSYNIEDLFRKAVENQEKYQKPLVKTMYEMIKDEIGASDEMPLEGEAENIMYVITNEHRQLGAAVILNEEILYEMSAKLNSDLYIMPSSIHETIAVSADAFKDPVELAEMVKEINYSQVDPEERLSNQVYHYNREERKLTQATNTQYKLIEEERQISINKHSNKRGR